VTNVFKKPTEANMSLGGLSGDDNAVLSIKTILGKGKLLVLRMQGSEYLSHVAQYRIELVANVSMLGKSEEIDFKKLLGTRANLSMKVPGDDKARHFNGFVIQMERGERHGRYESYTMVLRPWAWFLTRTRNCRVFQNKSAKEVIAEVLNDYSSGSDHAWRLSHSPHKREYCVQYDETDFDFVSRLLEEEGICYFFEHTENKHTLVMCDAMSQHKPKPVEKKVRWAHSLQHESTMINWRNHQELRANKVAARDHNYLASSALVEAEKSDADALPNKMGAMEIFEFPSGVVQNQVKPEAQSAASAAQYHAQLVLERELSLQSYGTGMTNARDMAVGSIFELEEPEDGLLGAAMSSLMGGADASQRAGKYLVISGNYQLEFADHEAIKELQTLQRRRDGFVCDVIAIRTDGNPFRPPLQTPRPVMRGPQTAVVVGASGNEMECDKHGRIKVQFHWDRLGKKDANSSCYVRVTMPWAGQQFGMWTLPRVGHEVVVNFINGDADRPLVTGSVYNDQNLPPYELPAHATVSGIKSRSSKSGTADNANELRFEDKKGKEYVWLQAEKDFYRWVKNDSFEWVGANETIKTKLNRKDVVGENLYQDIGQDCMQHIGKDLHVQVDGDIFISGDATYQQNIKKDISLLGRENLGLEVKKKIDILAGDNLQLQTKADFSLKTQDNLVHEAGGKISLKAVSDLIGQAANIKFKANGNVVIEATGGITLKVGGSLVNISPAGIDIIGAMVKINSGGSGGSAASAETAQNAEPGETAAAKKEKTTAPDQSNDYDKLFKDPLKVN
jgi:type VI secretion system secreted protein VgrG